MKLTGPFKQIITMRNLPLKGPLRDNELEIIQDAGIVTENGLIAAVAGFTELRKSYPHAGLEHIEVPMVLLPGFIDSHTHICFGGNRRVDYAMRNAGSSYLDIARAGGGIWSSVQMTREATAETLTGEMLRRINRHISDGVTTLEVKTGYGLNMEAELKMWNCIRDASKATLATLIPTCLAAHIKPQDFDGGEPAYLDWILAELLPAIRLTNFGNRVDIFIEETAFSKPLAAIFLSKVVAMGFDCTVHADQFTVGSSLVAIAAGAVSADHLEASTDAEIEALAKSATVATVLPGASFGIGMPFAPARKLLNAGCCLAIASDWNPGSAPQGDLLVQAAVLGAFEKLSAAEIFAGLTSRAAHALRLKNVGSISTGMKADLQAYALSDYRDILYNQGKLKPSKIWIGGELVETKLG